jgi:hypothetical protein
LGTLNILGYNLNLLTYNDTYADETNGQTTPFIDPDSIVMTAPGIGRTLYGAVSQLEEDGENYRLYAMAIVPKYMKNALNHIKTYKTSSRPLPIFLQESSAISAKVIF